VSAEDRLTLPRVKAKLCDCGNPICFGSLTMDEIRWMIQRIERGDRLRERLRKAAKT
jgi:hypothetical protein